MPLTDENKEKNAENLKKTRKNDEKQSPGEWKYILYTKETFTITEQP